MTPSQPKPEPVKVKDVREAWAFKKDGKLALNDGTGLVFLMGWNNSVIDATTVRVRVTVEEI